MMVIWREAQNCLHRLQLIDLCFELEHVDLRRKNLDVWTSEAVSDYKCYHLTNLHKLSSWQPVMETIKNLPS